MALQSSGPISYSQILYICRGANSAVSMGSADIRALLGDTSGAVYFSHAYGKPAAGSRSFTTPGTYSFLVPAYQYLNVDIRGAGGSGGAGDNHNVYGYGNCGYDGEAGGLSQFGSVVAYGGGGGTGNCGGSVGSDGGGTGGNVTSGGGASGGSGGSPQQGSGNGYNGGNGGRVTKTWTNAVTSGYPGWGTILTVVVGNIGRYWAYAQPGDTGAVYVSWS